MFWRWYPLDVDFSSVLRHLPWGRDEIAFVSTVLCYEQSGCAGLIINNNHLASIRVKPPLLG